MVGDCEHGTVAKDEVNKMREKMTTGAIDKINAMEQVVMRQKIAELQLRAKSERDIESKKIEMKAAVRQSKTHEGEYQLR